MRSFAMIFASAAAVCTCAGPTVGQGPSPVDIVARGGTLDATKLPARTVEVFADRLVVWGITEVPGESRLQMATAGVDAITRAELLKYLDVAVASVMHDSMTAGATGDNQKIHLAVAEAVRGALPAGPQIQHGWARMAGPEGTVLRIVGRLEVDREFLSRTVSHAPDVRQLAERVMSRAFSKDTP